MRHSERLSTLVLFKPMGRISEHTHKSVKYTDSLIYLNVQNRGHRC